MLDGCTGTDPSSTVSTLYSTVVVSLAATHTGTRILRESCRSERPRSGQTRGCCTLWCWLRRHGMGAEKPGGWSSEKVIRDILGKGRGKEGEELKMQGKAGFWDQSSSASILV
jgi:hypothetical protein